LEIGIAYFEHGVLADSWSTLLNPPDLDWDSFEVVSSQAVHGITKRMVAGAPTFSDVVQQLQTRLEEPVWVGHNIDFDVRMFRQEFARSEVVWKFQPKLQLCTQRLAFELDKGAPNYKLLEVANRWGVVPEGAHRAVADAVTCGRVLGKMLANKQLPTEGSSMESFQKEAAVAWNRRPKRKNP
jgi:DNA polymerase-3 subunit epsilon